MEGRAHTWSDLRTCLGHGVDSLVGRMVRGSCEACSAASSSAAPSSSASATGLDGDDLRLVGRVEEFLARGRVLKEWWDRTYAAGSFAERFGLGRTFNPADRSFGFFDEIRRGAGRRLPVMGNYQEMFYDEPKAPRDGRGNAAEWMREQIREFILRYFMRVSDFREPEGYVEGQGGDRPPAALGPLSWCPRDDVQRVGFGFQQLYAKRRDTGRVLRFPEEQSYSIIDLREVGPVWEWLVLRVRIFAFNIALRPLGSDAPQLVVPLQEDSLLVVSRELVTDADAPRPGELGRYGFGYAFIKNAETGLLAYGPGEFDAAIETIDWVVEESGATRVAMVFVANRPERIMNLSFDPLGWGLRLADRLSLGAASRLLGPLSGAVDALPLRVEVDPVYGFVTLANLATAGLAGRELCISREQLEKDFLVKHFMQHYQAIAGSLATWRLVRDWRDASAIPAWVLSGRSS
jgi:hypothetical protein